MCCAAKNSTPPDVHRPTQVSTRLRRSQTLSDALRRETLPIHAFGRSQRNLEPFSGMAFVRNERRGSLGVGALFTDEDKNQAR